MTKITLKKPIEVDGAQVKTLTMREPFVEDQLIAQDAAKGESRQEVALFANLCEVTPEDIGKLTLADYVKLREIYDGFFD